VKLTTVKIHFFDCSMYTVHIILHKIPGLPAEYKSNDVRNTVSPMQSSRLDLPFLN